MSIRHITIKLVDIYFRYRAYFDKHKGCSPSGVNPNVKSFGTSCKKFEKAPDPIPYVSNTELWNNQCQLGIFLAQNHFTTPHRTVKIVTGARSAVQLRKDIKAA